MDISLQAAAVKPSDGEWAVAIWPMSGDEYIRHEDQGVVTLMTPMEARLFASLLVKYAEEVERQNSDVVELKGDLGALFRLIRGED